jgi:hypothetical protein
MEKIAYPLPGVLFVRVASKGLISLRVKKSEEKRNGFTENNEVSGWESSLFRGLLVTVATKGVSMGKLKGEQERDGAGDVEGAQLSVNTRYVTILGTKSQGKSA